MGGGTRWLLLFFWVAALSPFSNPNKNGASFEKLADDLAASLANSAASNEKNFQESALVELSKGYGGDVESVNVAEALVPEFSLIDWRNISEAQFKGAKPFYGELEKVLNRLTIALNQTLRERGYDSNVQLRVALVKTTMPNAFVYQQESPRPGKAINRAIVGMTTGYIHEYFGPDLNNISPETWETGWRSLIGTLAHEVLSLIHI